MKWPSTLSHATRGFKQPKQKTSEDLQITSRRCYRSECDRHLINKYGYRCTYDRDMKFLTSWLEILVLLRNLDIDILSVRRLLDSLTWHPTAKSTVVQTTKGAVELCRYEGSLKFLRNGELHMFTPFPLWVSCLSTMMMHFWLSDLNRKTVNNLRTTNLEP